MKKTARFILLSMIILASFTGCKKIVDAIFPGLDVDLPPITMTSPPILFVPPNEIPVASFSQHFNLDSMIRANTNGTFSINNISSVKISKINFTIPNADQPNNISNFESARFLFGSPSAGESAEVAAISFPDVSADKYLYTATNPPELINYFRTNELTYSVFGKIRRITTKPITLSMTITVRVR